MIKQNKTKHENMKELTQRKRPSLEAHSYLAICMHNRKKQKIYKQRLWARPFVSILLWRVFAYTPRLSCLKKII